MRPRAIGVIASGANPVESLKLVKSLGLECCQLSVPAKEWFEEPKISEFKKALEETGVTIVGYFCGFAGERYDDIPTIQQTVGLVVPATRDERLQIVLDNSDWIAKLQAPALLAHIGFVPEDYTDPTYAAVVSAIQQICDRCAKNGQDFGLETGQETAAELKQFISAVNRPNLKVNFDPANMLLYGSGNPMEAVQLLREFVISVHCKDGRWPTEAGQLGHEPPFGEGDVNVQAFLGFLKESNFTGPLIIEREISGEEQQRDIVRARDLIQGLR